MKNGKNFLEKNQVNNKSTLEELKTKIPLIQIKKQACINYKCILTLRPKQRGMLGTICKIISGL